MELDFSRLDKLAFLDFIDDDIKNRPATMPSEPLLEGGQGKTTPETEKPAEGLTGGERQLQGQADANKRALEAYQTYQQNIKTSGQLQSEILKGIKQGESVYNLFLKAAKAISLMTANTLFYSQLEADIKVIYGEGLLEPIPLEWELDEVRERLRRLREAYNREGEPAGSKARIASAIAAHESRAAHLEGLLSPALESV